MVAVNALIPLMDYGIVWRDNSGQFKKDYKRCIKRGLDMDLLKSIVSILAIPDKLQPENKVQCRTCFSFTVTKENIWNLPEQVRIQICFRDSQRES